MVIVMHTDVFRAWSNIEDQAFEKVVNAFKPITVF